MPITELTTEYVKYMPRDKKQGILYISDKFNLAIHKCACGCGVDTITPYNDPKEWTLTNNNGLITLRPSIGNFTGERPYHAHYFITDNKIIWC